MVYLFAAAVCFFGHHAALEWDRCIEDEFHLREWRIALFHRNAPKYVKESIYLFGAN